MSKTYYRYYQPNKKDVKDKYGDCTIRALSKVFEISWLEAFDLIIPYCRREQVSNIFDCPPEKREIILDDLGFNYHGISNQRGTTRPTVEIFTKLHLRGRYILNVARHVVACVDGHYYDTWDCGNRSLYGYFEMR